SGLPSSSKRSTTTAAPSTSGTQTEAERSSRCASTLSGSSKQTLSRGGRPFRFRWSASPMNRTPVGAAATLGALTLAGVAIAFAVGSSGHAGSPPHSSNQPVPAALRPLAQCLRRHGMPRFPDPVIGRNNVPVFPDSAPRVPAPAQRACASIIARIPPNYTSTQPVSSSDLQKLLALARCIRAHGVPDWPDPNTLGEFAINSRIQAGGKRLFFPAVHACARLNPNPTGGVNVIRARP